MKIVKFTFCFYDFPDNLSDDKCIERASIKLMDINWNVPEDGDKSWDMSEEVLHPIDPKDLKTCPLITQTPFEIFTPTMSLRWHEIKLQKGSKKSRIQLEQGWASDKGNIEWRKLDTHTSVLIPS